MQRILKHEPVKTRLEELPLHFSEEALLQEKCMKLYHLRGDDIKKEISDISNIYHNVDLNLLLPRTEP